MSAWGLAPMDITTLSLFHIYCNLLHLLLVVGENHAHLGWDKVADWRTFHFFAMRSSRIAFAVCYGSLSALWSPGEHQWDSSIGSHACPCYKPPQTDDGVCFGPWAISFLHHTFSSHHAGTSWFSFICPKHFAPQQGRLFQSNLTFLFPPRRIPSVVRCMKASLASRRWLWRIYLLPSTLVFRRCQELVFLHQKNSAVIQFSLHFFLLSMYQIVNLATPTISAICLQGWFFIFF